MGNALGAFWSGQDTVTGSLPAELGGRTAEVTVNTDYTVPSALVFYGVVS